MAEDSKPAGDVAANVARAKQELEQMMDLNPQVMLLVDTDGVIRRVNRAVLDLTGCENFEDVLGQPPDKIFDGAPSTMFRELIEVDSGFSSRDAYVRLPNGFIRELNFSAVGSGRSAGFGVIVVRDITGQKEELHNEERRHKREAVAALLGALMHNINQPLTVINVTSRLMQMALENPDADLAEVRQHCRTISSLTMDVKTMLERVQNAREYITERYLNGDTEILDLQRLAETSPVAEPAESKGDAADPDK